MGIRNADGSINDRCLDNVQPGEPIFVLRAQDACAPYAIKAWANRVEQEWEDEIGWKAGQRPDLPESVKAKLAEARATAAAMEAWPTRKLPD